MVHNGSCHCGKVSFEIDSEISLIYKCNCSHCSRKGYLMWFSPRAQFKLVSGSEQLAEYTFNKHAIKHQFCTNCGCAPFAFGSDKTGAEIAAINLRCLPDLDRSALPVKHVDGRRL